MDPPEAPPLTQATAQWQALLLPIFCVLPDPRALPGRGRARGSHFKAPGSTSLHPTALGIPVRTTGRRCVPEPGPVGGSGWTTSYPGWACVLFRYSGFNWWVLGGRTDLGAPSLMQGTTCFQAFLGVWRSRVGNQNPRPERPAPRLMRPRAGAPWVGPSSGSLFPVTVLGPGWATQTQLTG